VAAGVAQFAMAQSIGYPEATIRRKLMRTLYDLAGAGDAQRFSPYCFRVKLALHLKKLDYQSEPVRFTEKEKLAFSNQALVPVLRDGDMVICDSWKILQHLDAHYPETPQLLAKHNAYDTFIRHWCDKSLHMALFMVAAPFVHAIQAPRDQAYFRETREKRIGQTLEAVAADREMYMANLNRQVECLRATLADQAYLAGEHPGLADLLVLSAFMWTEAVMPSPLFAADDVIAIWMTRVKKVWAWV
jgi:glutathione S-transferase